MRPERITPSLRAVLLGSLLVVATMATGVTAAAQPADTDAEMSTTNHADAATENDTAEDDTAEDETTENETAEDVIESFQHRVENAETITATAEVESGSGNETTTSTTSIWVDYENNRSRTERNSSYGDTITVSNETGTVTYDVDDNTVRTSDWTFADSAPDFSLERVFNRSEVTLAGEEQVNGHEAYRLEIEPETERSNAESTMTLWLDTSSYLPVEYEVSSESEYGSYEMTTEFSNVSVNETFSDDRFTIDVPDDAERNPETDWSFERYDSLEELSANTSSAVTEVELPENYSFESGYTSEGSDYSTVTVTYMNAANETVTVSDTEGSTYNYSEHDRFESVEVGNRTGWYAEYEYGNTTTSMLAWECGENSFAIYGSLNESASTEIAESVPCE